MINADANSDSRPGGGAEGAACGIGRWRKPATGDRRSFAASPSSCLHLSIAIIANITIIVIIVAIAKQGCDAFPIFDAYRASV